jgi:hypothetical protein
MSSKNEEIGVAKEVLSYCGKCKLALTHIIVTMKNETTIGKCQCKTCSAKHNYRDPEAVVEKKNTATTRKKTAIPVAEIWKSAVTKTDGRAKPYAMDKRFKEGDLIAHATFGKGVVMQLIMDDKIQVQFEDALKLLICAQE